MLGDPRGCNVFIKKFATNKKTYRITFEDFINAFLPVDSRKASEFLNKPHRLAFNKSIKYVTDIFEATTFAQFSSAWRTYFNELNVIENVIRAFMKANDYKIEKVFFEMDQARKGYFDKYDLKTYLVENGTDIKTLRDQEIRLIMNFFDVSGEGRVKLDDFAN